MDEEKDGSEDKSEESVEVEEVVVEISDETKLILRKELGYTARDVSVMRPEIASMVVYSRLLRPTEGIPRNWYIEGTGPASPLRENAIKIAVAMAGLGALAVVGAKGGFEGKGIDLSSILDSLKKIPVALATIPKAVLSAGKRVKTEAVAALSESPIEEETRTFSEEEVQEMEEEVVHSIKPGEKAPNLNEDKTALDKFLTKIEDIIKGFFRIKI
jgi:hypothetical protein